VRDVALDFSGIQLLLEGLSAELARRFEMEWPRFIIARADSPFLRLALSFRDGPSPEGEYAPKAMASTLQNDAALFSMPEGVGRINLAGECEVELLRGLGAREYFTLVNMLRACLSWLLPSRGAMLLHAAGLVFRERAFLLVGAEGSGKSSWARIGEEEGAHVLSDDLVLIDGAGRKMEALGSPFRSTHPADYRPGRWPLAAILFPRHGEQARCAPVEGLLAKARLVANLTFIAEAVGEDARIAPLLDRVTSQIPCAELTFGLEPSFMDILRDWPEA
jgi:hypothetical protein